MTDLTWTGRELSGSVLFQLDVPGFTPEGTFTAAAARLDHLVDLGVDVVELLPIETAQGLTAFVDVSHARGLGVILQLGCEHLDPRAPDAPPTLIGAVAGWLRGHHLDGVRLRLGDRLGDPATPPLLAQLAAAVTILSVQLGRPLSVIAGSDVDTGRLVVPAPPAAPDGGHPGDGTAFASLESLADVLVRRFAAEPVPQHAARPAPGDRLTDTLSPGLRRVGATLLLTGPAIPVLSMGEEWDATPPRRRPAPEPALTAAGATTAASRPWWAPPTTDTPVAAAPPALDWSALARSPHRETLALYRRLIALRRQRSELAAPCQRQTHVRQGDHFLAVRRGSCVVVANLGRAPQRITVAGVPRRVLLATEAGVSLTHDAVDLPGESAAVVMCRRFDHPCCGA